MIPVAKLAIQYVATNPPKPDQIGVFLGDSMIAVVPLEDFKAIYAKLQEMEEARK